MNEDAVLITREELYEKIWQKPMIQLAKEFGISDVGLAKICKRMEIPRPHPGYWAQKNLSSAPSLKPLSKKGISQTYISPGPPRLEMPRMKVINEKITVPETLVEPHKFVIKTLKNLRARNTKEHTVDRYGRICLPENCLNINVTKFTIDRTCLIMDTLIKALEVKGYQVKVEGWRTYVCVNDEKIYFGIEELVKIIKITPDKKDRWSYQKYEYVSSGQLILKIRNLPYGMRCQWKDKINNPLENFLSKFVVALSSAAIAIKKDREEDEQRRREWQEEENRIAESLRLKEIEQQKIKKLQLEIGSWQAAQNIRSYLSDLENLDQKNERLINWIEWIKGYVKRIDPLLNIS